MKNSLRTALCILSSVCLATAVLVGCAQTGQERAQGYTQQNMLTQGYGTNNLVGARNYTGNRNNSGTNLWGNTGTNNRTGYTGTGNNTGAGYTGMGNNTRMGNNTGMSNNTGTGNYTGTNNAITGTQLSAADRQKASTIKRQLMNMKGVDEAEVIVMGNDCLVGVRTAGNTNAGQIKSAIAKRVKQIDSKIKNVTVDDTSDIMSRMRRLGMGTRTSTGNRMNGAGINGTRTNGTGMNGTNADGNNMMNSIADEFNRLMRRANNMTR